MRACCAVFRSWVIFGLTILTWVLSVTSTAVCDFIALEVSGIDRDGYGLFCRTGDYGDIAYELSSSILKVAQAFAVLNCIMLLFCFVGIFLVIFVLREKASRRMWVATRILLCVNLFFCLAVFIFYGTAEVRAICFAPLSLTQVDGVNCTVGPGAVLHAMVILMEIALVALGFKTPIPPSPVINCGGCCGDCCGDCCPDIKADKEHDTDEEEKGGNPQ